MTIAGALLRWAAARGGAGAARVSVWTRGLDLVVGHPIHPRELADLNVNARRERILGGFGGTRGGRSRTSGRRCLCRVRAARARWDLDELRAVFAAPGRGARLAARRRRSGRRDVFASTGRSVLDVVRRPRGGCRTMTNPQQIKSRKTTGSWSPSQQWMGRTAPPFVPRP